MVELFVGQGHYSVEYCIFLIYFISYMCRDKYLDIIFRAKQRKCVSFKRINNLACMYLIVVLSNRTIKMKFLSFQCTLSSQITIFCRQDLLLFVNNWRRRRCSLHSSRHSNGCS